jgi:thymidylate synthase (FAD)
MKIIAPSFLLIDPIDEESMLRNLERAGRVCYKSEGKICDGSAREFISNIIKREHESVLEHEKITIKITCDRGVSHEIVRHRIASYSQESTRYCNYYDQKFGKELTFIKPCFWNEESSQYSVWKEQMQEIEKCYFNLIDLGSSPQEARSILPNSLKTEIVVTMNIREWRHFFKLRTSSAAHPQMKEIATMILECLKDKYPVIFDDINNK